MLLKHRYVRSILLFATVLSPALFTDCTVRTGYRVYDPAYRDYHVWNDGEVVYYRRWVGETHRPYVEFRRLRPAERSEYWTWRHNHPNAP